MGELRDRASEVERRGVAVHARHYEREDVEVEGVAEVVRRLLAMAAVAGDLTVDLRQQNLTAQRRPAAAGGELRQRQTADVQCEGLAEQVGVRAEVAGHVRFDVRQLAIEGEEQID